jgi:hypothetical protein
MSGRLRVTERRADLERLLIAVQFDHPTQRALLVDEFYTKVRADDVAQLRADVKHVCLHAIERRTFWAHRDGVVAVARAVAYQSIVGMLIRVLDAGDAP